MRSTPALVAALVGSLSTSPLAADGVFIAQRMTPPDGAAQTIETQIEGQRMRTEIVGPGSLRQVALFDGVRQVMLLIDPARKSYREMSKADLDRLGAQMSDMMAKMKEALQKMPPEQRMKMESMMKGGVPGGPVRTEFKKTGSSKQGKWTCDTYEGFVNGQKTMDLCTVPPESLGLKASDFAVTRQMAEFFKGIAPQSADAIVQFGRPEEQGYSGIPVRTASSVAGRSTTTEVIDVGRRTFDATIFAVPAGFTKQTMPFGPGGPGPASPGPGPGSGPVPR